MALSGFRQKSESAIENVYLSEKRSTMTDHQSFAFDVLDRNRVNVHGILETFSPEQLNHIPDGFSNNLIWNAAHLLVTQQLLVHSLSGSEILVSQDWIQRFRKGSRPESSVSKAEIDQIMEALLDVPKKSRKMVANGEMSDSFKEYETSFGTPSTVWRKLSNSIIYTKACISDPSSPFGK